MVGYIFCLNNFQSHISGEITLCLFFRLNTFYTLTTFHHESKFIITLNSERFNAVLLLVLSSQLGSMFFFFSQAVTSSFYISQPHIGLCRFKMCWSFCTSETS